MKSYSTLERRHRLQEAMPGRGAGFAAALSVTILATTPIPAPKAATHSPYPAWVPESSLQIRHLQEGSSYWVLTWTVNKLKQVHQCLSQGSAAWRAAARGSEAKARLGCKECRN